MVAFDNSVFSIAIHPESKGSVDRANDRVEYLLDTLKQLDERIILPAPAFAEFLILAKHEGPLYMAKIREMSIFRIEPFDERAAVELADIELSLRAKGNKRGSVPDADWQKVKFDRQIIAIAKAHGCTCIYSDDPHIVKHGRDCDLEVIQLCDLPLPPVTQADLELTETSNDARADVIKKAQTEEEI